MNHGKAVDVAGLITAAIPLFDTVTKHTKARRTTLESYLRGVQKGRWKSRVLLARELLEMPRPGMERLSKAHLPAIKASGWFTGLDDASLRRHTGILCLDFDRKQNPSVDLLAIRDPLQEDRHVVAVHVSAGGAGLAVFVGVAATDGATHRRCFKTASHYFKTTFGLNVDPSGSNVGRNRFVSFDPDGWFRNSGTVHYFRPADFETTEPGVIIDTVTCDIISEKESLSPSFSHPCLEVRDGCENAATPTISHPSVDLAPASTENASPSSSPALSRIYERWLGHLKPAVGFRNQMLVERVPMLLSVVGHKVVPSFLQTFFEQNATVFAGYELSQWMRQGRDLIAACTETYATNSRVGLNPREREAYMDMKSWPDRRDTFRICRSLSRSRNNHGGEFSLTADHLSKRLGCHVQHAARQLEYLTAAGVLILVEKGNVWRAGEKTRASRYRWAL